MTSIEAEFPDHAQVRRPYIVSGAPLSDNSIAVGLFSRGDQPVSVLQEHEGLCG